MPEYEIKVAVHRQSNRVWETTVKVTAPGPVEAKSAAEEEAELQAHDIDFNQFSECSHYEVEALHITRVPSDQKAEEPQLHAFAKLYQIWGPDGIPISPNLYPTADVAVRAGAKFVAQYQQQGYYRDSRGQQLSLNTLAMSLRLEEHPALMTPEEAYDKYLATQPDVQGYLTFREFLGSDECIELMDPDAQEDGD